MKDDNNVVLHRDYKEIKFINCNSCLDGNKVELDYIAPFASVGFEVK